LSILDVAGGHQPMTNEDRTLWITYNGEIFNYLEIRPSLEARGHRFATRSDTEVILHAYEEYGEDCVQRFNGQWAFAIWDSKRERLFLSRDRLGVRPLYYAVAGGTFIFASEIKSILAHPAVSREVDLIALDQIFTFWHPLAPRTFFRGIHTLPPAHHLTVDASGVRVRRYWSLDYAPADGAGGEQRSAEQLRELLVDATRLRLRADVPVGAYLSGGLDSTVTAGLGSRFTDTPVRTFSVTFEDAEFDESSFQKDAVAHLGSEHEEAQCTRQDICRVFPEVIWHAETPILRSAPAPLYVLSELVRRSGYKVVLTGEGADEMLGGYDIFKEAKIRRFCAAQPDSKWRPLLLKQLYPYLPDLQAQSASYLRAFFHPEPAEVDNPFFSHLPRWNVTSRLKRFFSHEVRAALSAYDGLEEVRASLDARFPGWSHFAQAQWLETTGLLPGYILSSQGDRMGMAHSVEGRFPFLDHRVVEFAARLPPRLKMKGLDEKHILKRAVGDLVPPSVLRRPKQPYRAPDAASFFTGGKARADYVDELLCAESLRRGGLFDPEPVGRLVDKIRTGRARGARDNMALVGILSTQICIERFIGR
ncbi:MAG: asparagine synthase (glutamine-hydrolyzing), partial [Planctomycetes bacterium]|nr:asparagine synthase (glutamine-hydrolyzing) [Planctomycetota bacterium]